MARRGTKGMVIGGGLVLGFSLMMLLLGSKKAHAAEEDPEEAEPEEAIADDEALADVAEQTGAPVVVEDESGAIVPAPAEETRLLTDDPIEDAAAAEELAALDEAAEEDAERESLEVHEVDELAALDDSEEIEAEAADEVAENVHEAVPVPAPAPAPAPPPTAQDAQMLKSMLLAAEKRGGWKHDHRDAVEAYQIANGLKPDRRFGPYTALHLGMATGNPVPIVRYWPTDAWGVGSPPYLAYLKALTDAGLDASREKGQGFGSNQKPVMA